MSAAISQFTPSAVVPANAPVRDLLILAAKSNSFAQSLMNEILRLQPEWHCNIVDDIASHVFRTAGVATSCILVPSTSDNGMTPDIDEVKQLFERAAFTPGCQFVLLSNALIYGTGPARPGFVNEDYFPPQGAEKRIPERWLRLETLAREYLGRTVLLTILRPAIVPAREGLFHRVLSHRLALSLPGHDPVLQFLSLSDLAAATICAIQHQKAGVFNVAPDQVIPLHQAIRLNGGFRFPLPRTLQRTVRASEALDFFRYPWTVSNKKIKAELGFSPGKSSSAALREFRHGKQEFSNPESAFDEFGMDKSYIRFYGKSLFKFLSEYYWRIEDHGLEHIPQQGRGVLVGMHRGFMPWDGVMALHTIVKKTGRFPRFLTHPGLLKFPFLANFMTKLGGVIACQESAERVLQSNELVGIFPEGIHGAFTPYRDAYKLQAFGRDAFVKLALRHRAPIIPFVTVGSAEIFPIFGKIKSRRWTRYTEWPFIPITPTFPLLPVPLPSKWHTQFLPPIDVSQYPPDAAEDRATVKAISREVRTRMQQTVESMLGRRRSIFWGSIFERRPDERQNKPVAV
jgi:1-acyl-sn-glycerol-3-phosphate acyltransferase/nucleoside-diphosphate-sugar epimerase